MFTVGQQCQYRPNGMPCTIQRVFADRRRVRITLANGQELDEVAFHELEALPEPAAPQTSPAPEAPVAPEPAPEAQAEPQAAPQGLQTPESWRRRLREEGRRGEAP